MAQMKARRSFRYAGRRLTAGDAFDTKSDRDALLLEAAGRATRATVVAAKEAKRRGRPRKVDEPAAVLPTPTKEPEPARVEESVSAGDVADAFSDDDRADRFYRRRDLEAE